MQDQHVDKYVSREVAEYWAGAFEWSLQEAMLLIHDINPNTTKTEKGIGAYFKQYDIADEKLKHYLSECEYSTITTGKHPPLVWIEAFGKCRIGVNQYLLRALYNQFGYCHELAFYGYGENLKETQETAIKKGRRDSQVDRVVEVAKMLGCIPMNIVEGEKTKIKNECLKDASLFSENGFKRAWTEANNRNLIRMENKEKYL
ncbi:MAG: hypothetical protein ACXW1W_13445 [Methylococcaceae bacterium]